MVSQQGQQEHNRRPRARAAPPTRAVMAGEPADPLLAMQRTLGNQAVQRQLRAGAVPLAAMIAAGRRPGNRAVQRRLPAPAAGLVARQSRGAEQRDGSAGAPVDLVQETTAFFAGAADFYAAGAVVTADRLPRQLSGWLTALTSALAAGRGASQADEARTQPLRQAYARAVQALLAQAARQLRQPLDQLYRDHLDRIHESAWPAATLAAVATTRAGAETRLRQRWGVERVYEGTLDSQAARLLRNRMQYFGSPAERTDIPDLLRAAGWRAWSPAGGSDLYAWLVRAFERFERVFGGVPPVQEVAFYATDYRFVPPADGGPALRPVAGVAADFGGGQMAIYHTAETRATTGRIAAGPSAAGAPAATPSPTAEEGFQFNVIHELGHGLVEAVLGGLDPTMLNAYGAHVGWFNGRLYDGQVEAVRDAIDHQRGAPPAEHRITEATWNDGRWREQPLSAYMVSALSEDFPEAVAAYVTQPALLRQRSPRRYEFLHGRLASFRQALRRQLAHSAGGRAASR